MSDESMRSRQWPYWPTALLMAVLVLAWAVESFMVQTTAFPITPESAHPLLYAALRFTLNLAAATVLCLALPPRGLRVVFVADYLLTVLLLAYTSQFHQPPQLYWALHCHIGEEAMLPVILASIPRVGWLLLTVNLVAKFWLLRRATLPSWRVRGSFAGLSALIWLGIILLLQRPVSSFAVRQSASFAPGRMAYACGVLLQNALETEKMPGLAIQQAQLQATLAHPTQRLLAGLPAWPARRCVVILQLESVDWNAVESRHNGERVMPCLFDLKAHSLYWKMRVFHDECTADMDFAVLTGVPPPSSVIGYTLPNLEFSQSLPAFLHACRYRTVLLHGNDGDFFMRRASFIRMGFDQLCFKEDLRSQTLRRSYWGVRDGELFRLSAEQLRASPGRMFHLLITLDTHMPFDQIDDSEKEIFPGSHDLAENYFNSLRVLDRNLARYVAELPSDTLLVIYGDHSTQVRSAEFAPSRQGPAEYVACLVYDKSGGIAVGAGPRADAQGREYRITDIIGHLRQSLTTEQAHL